MSERCCYSRFSATWLSQLVDMTGPLVVDEPVPCYEKGISNVAAPGGQFDALKSQGSLNHGSYFRYPEGLSKECIGFLQRKV